MTCKDCIHYDVCYHIEHYGRHLETEEPCGGFLNKADVVEVVRCKDCEFFREYSDAHKRAVERADGDCFLKQTHSCDEQFMACRYNDFCSYGVKRLKRLYDRIQNLVDSFNQGYVSIYDLKKALEEEAGIVISFGDQRGVGLL